MSPPSILKEHSNGLHTSGDSFLSDGPSPSLRLADYISPQIQFPSHATQPDPTHSAQGATGATPGSADYETALGVLLSLGNSNSQLLTPFTTLNETSDHSHTVLSPVDFEATVESFPTCRHAPQAPIVRLIRHYVYRIAPWVRLSGRNAPYRLVGADQY